MAKKFREKLRKFNPFTRPMTLDELRKDKERLLP